jgi:ABC-type multidrug transport system ATPase subunit
MQLGMILKKRIVAELSQSMNFIMDLTVEEFLCLHAKSRMVESDYIKQLICKVLKCAK